MLWQRELATEIVLAVPRWLCLQRQFRSNELWCALLRARAIFSQFKVQRMLNVELQQIFCSCFKVSVEGAVKTFVTSEYFPEEHERPSQRTKTYHGKVVSKVKSKHALTLCWMSGVTLPFFLPNHSTSPTRRIRTPAYPSVCLPFVWRKNDMVSRKLNGLRCSQWTFTTHSYVR